MPDYDYFMSEAGLERIHQTALRILSELGIRTDHPGMRERLAALGCRIAGDSVYFPGELVDATVAAIPSGFKLHGRDPLDAVTVEARGRTLFTNTGIFPNICDFESGAVRRSTSEDVALTTRVLDALPNVDVVYATLVDATELPPHVVTVAGLALTLANTAKPLVGPGATSGPEAEAIVALASAVRNGSRSRLRDYPPCTPFICPITPLRFPREIVDALIVIAEASLPLDVISNPVMGVSAPYTIAANVALGHAEVLAAAVMAHAVAPGLPILHQCTPSVADMRTLSSTTGGPETGLMRRTVIELAQRLGIPSCAHGHTSSARLDSQAADEKAINTLLIAGARPSLLGGMGALANVTLTSYETLLMDNERFGAIRRVLDGVATGDEHLAFGVIADQVNGGEILGHEHTLRHLRGREVWRPGLAVRQGLVGGALPPETALDRARSEARRLMDRHRVEPLLEDVQRALDEIVSAYDRAHA